MTTLREAVQQFVADYDCGGCGHFAAYAENFRKLLAQEEQPNRAQQMRDAGYTRRPTLREMAQEEQEPTVRIKCTVVDNQHPNGIPFEQWVNAPQQEQEPVRAESVTTPPCKGMNCGAIDGRSHSLECHAEHSAAIAGGRFVPLPRREWQSLSDKEISAMFPAHLRGDYKDLIPYSFARAIEAALKEKNNV